MAESESDPPKDVHASRLKSLGTLIAAIAALVTATGAYFKPQDHSVNKASYEEITKTLKEMSDQTDKNHDDIVALRGYMEGVAASRSAPLPVTFPPDAGAATPHVLSSPSASTTVAYVQLPPKPPPPPVHTAARPQDPPSFDAVVQKASKK